MTFDAKGTMILPGDTLESMVLPERHVRFVGEADGRVMLSAVNWVPCDQTPFITIKSKVWDRLSVWRRV